MESYQERFITVFSGTLWEAEMVKSLLLDAGIESFVKNDTVTSYAYEPIRSSGVMVVISENDQVAAKEIVESYYQNMKKN
jgi:hypothetical protein